MSGLFDKRTDGQNRRQERDLKELQDKKKVRIIAVCVTSVLAVLIIGAIFINSKYFRRLVPAITVGGQNFSAVEFDYYFRTSYNNYVNYMNDQYGEYASQFGLIPDTSSSLATQENPSTGGTWETFFVEYTINQMAELVQFHNAAKADNYTLTDEKKKEIDDEIESLVELSKYYGYSSFNTFLMNSFGMYMDEATFRKITEYVYIATGYSSDKYKSFTYTDAELTAYYDENKDTFDVFSYRYFLVTPESLSQDDFTTTEEYEAAKEAALEVAVGEAEEIVAGIEDEAGFKAAAESYNPEKYGTDASTLQITPGSYLSADYGPWLQEPGRMQGDITTSDTTSGTYIIYFVERDSNDYRITSMRQMLFMPADVHEEDVEVDEDDPAHIEAEANAWTAAKAKAEEAFQIFKDGGATEAKMLEMIPDYSEDTTEGGLYENITRDPQQQNKMVAPIEKWLFDPARVEGDSELIETEYGYHILYFMGHGDHYGKKLAENAMREKAYTEWKDGLGVLIGEKRWGFTLTSQR